MKKISYIILFLLIVIIIILYKILLINRSTIELNNSSHKFKIIDSLHRLSKSIPNNIQEEQEGQGELPEEDQLEQQDQEGNQEVQQDVIPNNNITHDRKYLSYEDKLKILSDIIKSHTEIDIKEITKLFSSKTSYEPNVQTTKKLIDQLVKRKEIKFKKSGRIKMYSTI